MRDHALKARRRGELGIDVLRVDVAGHRGKELDIRGSERALNRRVVAYGNFVKVRLRRNSRSFDVKVLFMSCLTQ